MKECRKISNHPIGVAKVEYDDESSTQMLYIYNSLKKITNNVFFENIKELYIDYDQTCKTKMSLDKT